MVCTKLLSLCTDSMFAKTRCSLKKVLIVAVRSCGCGALIRGLENLGASRKGNGFILFACTKRTKSTPEVCEPLDSGERFKALSEKISAEFSSGTCRNRFCQQNAGEKALNRCERVAVVQTQDRCFSKMKRCTASSQWQAVFEKGCCTLVLLRWEVVAAVR